MLLNVVEEFAELVGLPNFHLALLARAELWRIGKLGDVADHASLSHRIGERLVQRLVNRMDRLRCETALIFSTDRERGVERVEVLRA